MHWKGAPSGERRSLEGKRTQNATLKTSQTQQIVYEATYAWDLKTQQTSESRKKRSRLGCVENKLMVASGEGACYGIIQNYVCAASENCKALQNVKNLSFNKIQ